MSQVLICDVLHIISTVGQIRKFLHVTDLGEKIYFHMHLSDLQYPAKLKLATSTKGELVQSQITFKHKIE